jgi:DNA-binding MarR family transcriptional regulator
VIGPKSPSQLASIEKKHVSHVSRALAEMKSRGLVEYWRTDSRERYYRVTTQGYFVYGLVARMTR